MQVISRQVSSREIDANTDQVIAYCALPTGAKLNNVWLESAITKESLSDVIAGHFYGVSGFVVNIDDPDGDYDWDQIWDGAVRKDATLDVWSTADIDTPSNTEPEFEVGLVDLDSIMGLGAEDDMQIFQRRKMVTWAGNPVGFDGTSKYIPSDYFKTHIKGGPRVNSPSGVIFGLSSPEMAETTTAYKIPVEKEWLVLQFLDMFLEDMFKWNIGLGTVTSNFPYEAGSDYIAKFLESAMFEPSGQANLYSAKWHVNSKITFDVTIPGMQRVKVITSDK